MNLSVIILAVFALVPLSLFAQGSASEQADATESAWVYVAYQGCESYEHDPSPHYIANDYRGSSWWKRKSNPTEYNMGHKQWCDSAYINELKKDYEGSQYHFLVVSHSDVKDRSKGKKKYRCRANIFTRKLTLGYSAACGEPTTLVYYGDKSALQATPGVTSMINSLTCDEFDITTLSGRKGQADCLASHLKLLEEYGTAQAHANYAQAITTLLSLDERAFENNRLPFAKKMRLEKAHNDIQAVLE